MSYEDNCILKMTGIKKSFPGVQALKGVDFELKAGEVCGLLGENGAGKSTLMKVLGGVYHLDAGQIYIEDVPVEIKKPSDADDKGIMFVHQELSLFQKLDVATNIFTQKIPRKGPFIWSKKLYGESAKILAKLNMGNIDPRRIVNELKIGEQQLIEISRCLVMNTKVLVLDEPTSSLTMKETETLFNLIGNLKERGVSIVFISHRLDEVYEICDRVTIMRDGKNIITKKIGELSRGDVVHHMLGRTLKDMFRRRKIEAGDELLKVSGITRRNKFENINLAVHRKEIVGLYGLLGSGRSEIMRSIVGLDKFNEGDVYFHGQRVNIKCPQQAIGLGVGFVPEDRRKDGLVLKHSVGNNLVMANLREFTKFKFFMNWKKELEAGNKNINDFSIKTPSLRRAVQFLSGGNQQKVVIAKCINTRPELLILDEPTRGVDVGAKSEIYEILGNFVLKGMGILIVSSELNEVCELCDRVYVIKRGKIVAEFGEGKIIHEDILSAAMGV
jgi:ABC-type sugar transport system ATPase subunit